MKWSLIPTFAVVLLISTAATAHAADAVKWQVAFTPDGDGKPFKDTLTFKADQLDTVELAKRGFAAATYEEDTRRMGPSTFTATLAGEKAGKAKFTGTIAADQISGELVITTPDGSETRYTFTGTKAH